MKTIVHFARSFTVISCLLALSLSPCGLNVVPAIADSQPLEAQASSTKLYGGIESTGIVFTAKVDESGRVHWAHYAVPSTQFLKGDRIIAINEYPFSLDLWKAAFRLPSGTEFIVTLIRNGAVRRTSVITTTN